MIKRVTLMTRKPGMTREAFADYWTRVHAPLLASHPAVKRFTINVTQAFVRFSIRNEDPDDPLYGTIDPDHIAARQYPTARRAILRQFRPAELAASPCLGIR